MKMRRKRLKLHRRQQKIRVPRRPANVSILIGLAARSACMAQHRCSSAGCWKTRNCGCHLRGHHGCDHFGIRWPFDKTTRRAGHIVSRKHGQRCPVIGRGLKSQSFNYCASLAVRARGHGDAGRTRRRDFCRPLVSTAIWLQTVSHVVPHQKRRETIGPARMDPPMHPRESPNMA